MARPPSSSSSRSVSDAPSSTADSGAAQQVDASKNEKKTPTMRSGEEKQGVDSRRDAYKNSKGSAQTKAARHLAKSIETTASSWNQENSTSTISSSPVGSSSSSDKEADAKLLLTSTVPIVRATLSKSAATAVPSTLVSDPAWRQFHQQALSNDGCFEVSERMNVDAVCRWLASSPAGVNSIKFTSDGRYADKAIALVVALKDNAIVTDLHLGHNGIKAEGAKEIARMIKENKRLTALHLKDNDFGVEGAIAIAEALKDNKTINSLSISDNSIGDEGVRAFIGALKANTVLATFDYSPNSIRDEFLGNQIDAELKINRQLREDKENEDAKKALELINFELGKVDHSGSLKYPREVMDQIVDQMAQAGLRDEIADLSLSIKPKE